MIRLTKKSFTRFSSIVQLRKSSTAASILNIDNSSNGKVKSIIDADLKEGNPVPVFKRALLHKSIALKDQNGEFSYFDLVAGSKKLSSQISNLCGEGTNSRIAYLCPNDVSHILTQWSCWISGQIAVPLSAAHPPELLEYFIEDSQSNLIITTPEFESRMKIVAEKLNKPLLTIEHSQLINDETRTNDEESLITGIPDGQFYKKSPAMIVYTSGTTNKPKGVVFSHSNLDSQVACLSHAWNIQSTDTILHSLPLHHVHGLINAMLSPLCAGGKIIMLPKFETESVWSYLLNINMPQKDRISLFMGVPTIYNYLIQDYDKLFSKNNQMKDYIKTHCKNKIRLMVSGSAPLPQPVFQRWRDITGHNLLERYGMTETGMALSNTLKEDKVRQRLPGFVGRPLPNVQIRIVNPEDTNDVLLEAKGDFNKGLWASEIDTESDTVKTKTSSAESTEVIGYLQVKGPTVFTEYWNKPEATKKEFTKDGWFNTGDSVCFDSSVSSFKILGRNSCDIIKSRGYKISALEMETKLLENRVIEDCAVIGIPDEVYGQKIVALVIIRASKELETAEQESEVVNSLNKWCQSKFADYSLPSIKIIKKLPRNQMGKVNKADLVKDFISSEKS